MKDKSITFRVDKDLFDFLGTFTKKNGFKYKSHLIRKILEYFYMAYSVGDIKKPYDKLEKQFLDMVENFKNS